jgi:hypothetical protein
LDPRSGGTFVETDERLSIGSEQVAEREEAFMSSIDVEAARIPDRDRLLQRLREHGLDAQPYEELGIKVECADDDAACDELLSEVEGLVMDLGATMIPVKHEGVIYVRPPVG